LEIAASIINVDSKWLSTFKINIPQSEQFFSLSPIGWILLSWLPVDWHIHVSLRIRLAENKSTFHINIHILKVLDSLLCIFMMWWANLLSTFHIMNALSSLVSTFMKKIAGLCQHHECGMLNFDCA
jgi:glucan phosphoethanolaminetransferase (alkaline phosphatase superfamily)